jgi:hypothetical protein
MSKQSLQSFNVSNDVIIVFEYIKVTKTFVNVSFFSKLEDFL